jgi:antirestriction protein
MATVTIEFTFESTGDEEQVAQHEFELDTCIEDEVLEYIEDYMKDNDLGDDWDCTSEEVWEVEIDGDEEASYDDFKNLIELAEYAIKVEEYGEGYALRYKDIGEFDFPDSYHGCWSSTEEYAQDMYEGIYGRDNSMHFYIDWEKYARDLMMDYSVYESDDGLHIFSDC